jgi:1,5-anhydro-D-fructose reductase (1,5-anhydro-D-mannitol-forming)
MPSSKVRFAILGFGNHAVRRLIPAFSRCTQAELTGLWRRNAEAAADSANTYHLQAYATAEELCADPAVNVVFITSPDAMHLADCELAFRHGKAVLCEKPLAMNAGQAAAIQSAADAAGTVFGVGQNFRYNPSVEYLREQILAGRIGTPQLAHAQYAYPGHLAPRKWITDPTLACGGPIADVGVHCIDTLRYILSDDPKSISVLASKDERSGEVEAMATMQFAMRSGAFANVTATARAPYRTLIEILGSEGTLIAENCLTVDRPVDVIYRKAGDHIETKTFNNSDGYVLMLDAFAKAFRGEGSFLATGPDAAINQRILDAAFRSWHSGLRETL